MTSITIPHPTVKAWLDRSSSLSVSGEEHLNQAASAYVRQLDFGSQRQRVSANSGAGPQGEAALHIGLLTRWSYPHKGGLSNYIATLAASLQDRGHRVEVISQSTFGDRWSRTKDQLRHRVHRAYDQLSNSDESLCRSEYNIYTFERLLLERDDLRQFDLLHAHDLFTANILLRNRRHHRAAVFYTPHGIMTERKIYVDGIHPLSAAGRYYRFLDHAAASWSDRVITLYHAFSRRLSAYGADGERTQVVYTGIPRITQAATHADDGEVVITYVGRLTPTKGPQHLLDAWRRLRSQGYQARVDIVGDGGMSASLKRQVRRYGLKRVRLLGHRSDVPRLLAASDILVVPGVNESFPLAMLEGMMAGLAVVASDCGGIPEAVRDNETGLLFPPGDSHGLSRCLARLLDQPELRQNLGASARESALEHFTVDTMTRQIEAAYRRLLPVEAKAQ